MRMKARGFLLSAALILSCFCFFACKETKVEIDSIAFVDESIELLVGEEYSPEIKILPSYVSDRSYTLISSDVTALKVDGGTIRAEKAGVGIKLKVVSNTNEKVNDVISVNIYNEAEELEAPKNLSFDGDKFVFEAVDNVSSYVLKINEQEINIGNNTEYLFANVAARVSEPLFDKVVECSVRSIGDGRIYKDSQCSDSVKFIKIGEVSNFYIEDNVLYFDALPNVAEYNVDIESSGNTTSLTITNSEYNEGVLSYSLEGLNIADQEDWSVRLSVSTSGYNADNGIQLYQPQSKQIVCEVITKVENVALNNYTLSWDLVDGAEFYEIKLYKDAQLFETFNNVRVNYLKLDLIDGADYWCEVLAKTSKTLNVKHSQQYSDKLSFRVLNAPDVTIDNNSVGWAKVDGADGYLVNVNNSSGETIVNNKFVTSETMDVGGYSAGTYSITLVACGDNNSILSSRPSGSTEWTVLEAVTNVKIANKKLYWSDLDVSSLNMYKVAIHVNAAQSVNLVLTNDKLGDDYWYDENNKQYVYSLTEYDFDESAHNISIQSVGENNIFDSVHTNTQLIKLKDSKVTEMVNSELKFDIVENACTYKIEIYQASDTAFSSPIITSDAVAGSYTIDSSLLDAGDYKARVYVYGNNADIFDADNTDVSIFEFKKLAVPTISVNGAGMEIIVQQTIQDAESYKLFENGKPVQLQDGVHSIAGLTAGEFTYTCQALGNRKDVLNSDVTSADDAIKVKKLSAPSIEFDKSNLVFEIQCADSLFVNKYQFLLNEVEMTVVDNKVNASSAMTEDGDYTVNVVALPVVSSEYDLIIKSEAIEHTVNKLGGECLAEMAESNLIITPVNALGSGDYELKLRIVDDKGNELVLDGIKYKNSKFLIPIYDSKYNVIGLKNDEDVQFFASEGNYNLYTTISKLDAEVVSSNEVACANGIVVLDEVDLITRSSQNIKFSNISNAGGYLAYVTFNSSEWYLDINGKFEGGDNNTLPMDSLIELMDQNGIPYQAGAAYSIGFVTTSSSGQYVSNKGAVTYSFEFLPAPTIGVAEEGNSKYFVITNNIDNASWYSVDFIQESQSKNLTIVKEGAENRYGLSNLDTYNAGNIQVKAKVIADAGNYFESKYSTCNVVKIASSTIKITNGVITWSEVSNAKQYNLHYIRFGVDNTVALYEGVEGFSVNKGICSYIFDGLDDGIVEMYLQVDSILENNGTYYTNSNDGEHFVNVYKLAKPTISVVNGDVCLEISNADKERVSEVEVLLDGESIAIDVLTANDNITIIDSGNKTQIKINPNIILKYSSTSILTSELLAVKLYSIDNKTINSSYSEKALYGLLSPQNLDVTTSTGIIEGGDAISEVMEKLSWTNPIVNAEYVVKYEVIIIYLDKSYKFESNTNTFMMPKFVDANSNGNLDEDEVEFGAGLYTIKVKAITDNNDNVVNSKYSSTIQTTVLDAPINLATSEGNIVWDSDLASESYLIRVYLLDGENRELIVSSETKSTEFDTCKLEPFEMGVYGITVQSMHSSNRILVSEESEMFEVIRLPQVEGYYIKNGIFYVRVHKFFNIAEISLTDSATNKNRLEFQLTNQDLDDYNTYIQNIDNWSSSDILLNYQESSNFVDVPYINNNDYTLRQALAEGYDVEVKLIGNTCVGVGAIISGHALPNVPNLNYENDELVKLATPTVNVSETVRGQFELSLNESIKYTSLQYYADLANGTSLQGVHLYNVSVNADKSYNMLVAEVVDQEKLDACATIVQEDETKNNLKYFVYDGKYFNMIDNLYFNFSTDYYYYYTSAGAYSSINLISGGSFIVNARLLGDDTHFVQSNLSASAIIKRYSVLNMEMDNGLLKWANQGDWVDEPIYIISLNDSFGNKRELVLYNPATYSEEQLRDLVEIDSGKTYIYDTIQYSINDEYITYDGLAKIAYTYFGSNGITFTANIMTYFTDNTSNNKLLAQSTIAKTITVLPINSVNVQDGVLKWNLSYVEKSGGGEYINRYQFVVCDESGSELYSTIITDAEYSVKSYVAYYELPKEYDGKFTFTPGNNYIFNIKALAGDSVTYVNSMVEYSAEVGLLPTIRNLKMSDGLLTWNNTTTSAVEVHITYMLDDTQITYVTTTTEPTFDLPKTAVLDSNGTSRLFMAGYDYSIKVRLRGGENSLNGFYSEPITTQRLGGVDETSIVATNGVLTWNAVDVDNASYVLTYTLSNGNKSSINLDTTSFDFAGLVEGEIIVSIYAKHSDYFSSFNSENKTLFKLSVPTNMEFQAETTIITWDKVLDNNNNEINDYKIRIKVGENEPTEYYCDMNSWTITNVGSNEFGIAISAISTQVGGNLINGEFTSYVAMVQPEAVDGATFTYNESKQRFEWLAIEDEQSEDKYYIGYHYSALGSQSSSLKEALITKTETVGDQKYYYYYPYAMGDYRQIYVKVVRAKSLASNNTYWSNENGENHSLTFDLFNNGDGTELSPYQIYTEEHLRNIKYFPSACYKILDNIYLTSSEPITTANIEFGGSITTEGEFYIYNYTMLGDESGLLPITYVGLFSRTNGATFNNVKVSNLTINGCVNSANVYVGGLVAYAKNTVFNNIKITNSLITVRKNSEDGDLGYISPNCSISVGGIVGYADNCSVSGCEVSLSNETGEYKNVYLQLEGNASTLAYVGGIVGQAVKGTYSSNTATFNIRYTLTKIAQLLPQIRVGVILGYSNDATLDSTEGLENLGTYNVYDASGGFEKFTNLVP